MKYENIGDRLENRNCYTKANLNGKDEWKGWMANELWCLNFLF